LTSLLGSVAAMCGNQCGGWRIRPVADAKGVRVETQIEPLTAPARCSTDWWWPVPPPGRVAAPDQTAPEMKVGRDGRVQPRRCPSDWSSTRYGHDRPVRT
jgi:hypothetical protein